MNNDLEQCLKWKKVHKAPSKQPLTGTYSEWKEQIASECFHQCVYCSIHEAQFGGINNYHIEHYKPQSKFRHLENDICNLFLACPICNKFKSDDWPCDSDDLNKVCYPDPSKTNYNSIFEANSDFRLVGKFTASRYLITRLFLNRPQLIFERRESVLRYKCSKLIENISSLIQILSDDSDNLSFILDVLRKIDLVKTNILKLDNQRRTIRPYSLLDIRKTK
ncbi:HNH endonuclease [Adhaeribacter radiodurans]|uniref:HNH endonuclease n=1 Tax=Adhaeribacter radiodurans TaxID=2745197 RepID=A0A7L7L523_9BACT|nr:HNH endonuclease [Adhaeribacter radiodurans]QMU27695.1 HNH endonuclease [Adhaeribacter radiodurans]